MRRGRQTGVAIGRRRVTEPGDVTEASCRGLVGWSSAYGSAGWLVIHCLAYSAGVSPAMDEWGR
jgi:hypothetical protein